MSDIYNDDTYLTNNPNWHEEDAPFKTGKIVKLLQRNNIPLNTVCETGCGSGEILVLLGKALPEITSLIGYDISAQAIKIAAKKETANIKFALKDITNASDNSFFDLLLVIDVIEHIENYFAFLRAIANKSSHSIFHIPLDMSVWSLFREKMLIESKKRVGHIHNFTEEFILSILEDNGFTIIDKMYTEPTFTVINTKQKIVNGLRKMLFGINQRFCSKTLGGYSILVLTKNQPKIQ
jgi:predicted TPR repeat methyltransferase